MSLIRTDQSLAKIEGHYRQGRRGKKHLRSYYLPPYQIDIIDDLVEMTGKGKAEVLRDLIDEWCELQLGER